MERVTTITFHFKDIGKIFFPMLLIFLVAKIIIQTDLIMLAPLGEYSLAAFAIPTRVMLLDIIAAFAISPVISVIVSGANLQERNAVIQNCLSFSIYFSVVLMVLGLLIYPFIIRHMIKIPNVAVLAQAAVFWLTIAIPARFVQAICSMIFFGSKRGHFLYPIYAVAITINAVLNWFFIYYMHMGFSGSYFATFITAHLELMGSLFILRKDAPLIKILKPPGFIWLRNFIGCMSAELGRVISWQLMSFVIVAILASKTVWAIKLSVYAVAMEFYLLLLVPIIVAMRSIAIFLGSHQELLNDALYRGFKKIMVVGVAMFALFSVLLVISQEYIGKKIYHLSDNILIWWSPFMYISALLLPILFLNAIQRAMWQSRKRFKFIFLLELILTWPINLITIYYGLHLDNPWIMWSGTFIIETIIFFALYYSRARLDPVINC